MKRIAVGVALAAGVLLLALEVLARPEPRLRPWYFYAYESEGSWSASLRKDLWLAVYWHDQADTVHAFHARLWPPRAYSPAPRTAADRDETRRYWEKWFTENPPLPAAGRRPTPG